MFLPPLLCNAFSFPLTWFLSLLSRHPFCAWARSWRTSFRKAYAFFFLFSASPVSVGLLEPHENRQGFFEKNPKKPERGFLVCARKFFFFPLLFPPPPSTPHFSFFFHLFILQVAGPNGMEQLFLSQTEQPPLFPLFICVAGPCLMFSILFREPCMGSFFLLDGLQGSSLPPLLRGFFLRDDPLLAISLLHTPYKTVESRTPSNFFSTQGGFPFGGTKQACFFFVFFFFW